MHSIVPRSALVRLSLAVAFAAVIAAPSRARAQAGDISVNPFHHAMDSRGYITVNASQVLGHGDLAFGLVTDWGYKLVKLEDPDGDTFTVDNMVTPTLLAAVGLKLGPAELEFGVTAPFVIMAGDRNPDDPGVVGDPNDDREFGLSGQGLGNVGVNLKTRFLSTSRGPKVGLALVGTAYLPTVSEKARFLGEDKLAYQVMLVLDKEFGKNRDFRAALNAGFRGRTGTKEYTDVGAPGQMGSPATNVRIAAPQEIPFGLGLAYALAPQKFDVLGEVYGSVPLDGAEYQPLEAIGGIKVYLARNSFLTIGGGAGVIPDKAANPTARAFIGIVFEPNIGDRDGDGYKDDVDGCPDDPEDYDQFEDDDGCPEPDNDKDGILDEDDKCPLNPEDKDNFEDKDGCPEGNVNDRDGDGLLDDVDQCPDDPEDFDKWKDEDGCPDPDNDDDGILDVDDLCPNDPEDQDGWEDEDGCPDPDNDKDRILDNDDRCPNEPETRNGFEDEDGCPDRGRVILTGTKIEILDKVFFEYNKDIIKSESFPILDAVAATLEGNPDIQLIEVQGHTDEQGNDAYNLDLSRRRAASVRRYLLEKGIAEDRLESQGYGETQPLDNRKNQAAYAKNRRVEFLILKRSNDTP